MQMNELFDISYRQILVYEVQVTWQQTDDETDDDVGHGLHDVDLSLRETCGVLTSASTPITSSMCTSLSLVHLALVQRRSSIGCSLVIRYTGSRS